MRQSRRTNTGNRRDTVARRWRPWQLDERLAALEETPQDIAVPVIAPPTDGSRSLAADHRDATRLPVR